ncbi:MAG: hypothetical protein KA428_14545 [Chitinophagaceae bacterium]|nr:hypothetical protein [Chitinophagaceae bacterium]
MKVLSKFLLQSFNSFAHNFDAKMYDRFESNRWVSDGNAELRKELNTGFRTFSSI